MRKLAVVFLTFTLSTAATAMSIIGYEKTVQMSESPGPNRFITKAALESYFQGMAETLTFLKSGTDHVYFDNRPYLCVPPSANLSGAMLRGMLDAELKNPEILLRAFGKDWKEYQIATLLIPLASRAFPCPK